MRWKVWGGSQWRRTQERLVTRADKKRPIMLEKLGLVLRVLWFWPDEGLECTGRGQLEVPAGPNSTNAPTDTSQQTAGPISPCSEDYRYICTVLPTGGRIGLPGHVLAPNERVDTAATLPKTKVEVKKSQLELQQTRMSHHHCCCCSVEAVIMIKLLLLCPQFCTSRNCLLFYNIRMISCKHRTKY